MSGNIVRKHNFVLCLMQCSGVAFARDESRRSYDLGRSEVGCIAMERLYLLKAEENRC